MLKKSLSMLAALCFGVLSCGGHPVAIEQPKEPTITIEPQRNLHKISTMHHIDMRTEGGSLWSLDYPADYLNWSTHGDTSIKRAFQSTDTPPMIILFSYGMINNVSPDIDTASAKIMQSYKLAGYTIIDSRKFEETKMVMLFMGLDNKRAIMLIGVGADHKDVELICYGDAEIFKNKAKIMECANSLASLREIK